MATVKLLQCFADETVCYGSGKVAYNQGDALLLLLGTNGTTLVFRAGVTAKDIEHYIGLLYTYGPHVPVELDNRCIKQADKRYAAALEKANR
jgi:hypothetical protein